jgi:hypothetical protein
MIALVENNTAPTKAMRNPITGGEDFSMISNEWSEIERPKVRNNIV